MLLQDDRIRLRAMEPEDCEAMYRWENDTSLWTLGDSTRPFSRATLEEFIAQSSLDIYQARQLRLIIEPLGGPTSPTGTTPKAIGCVDLFAFDPLNRRAGVGILIYDPAMRRKGYASAAIELIVAYAFDRLDMRQLWADLPVSNTASLALFRRAGFSGEAVRRGWVRREDGRYEDALFVQRFR